jgi:hypothetical protein
MGRRGETYELLAVGVGAHVDAHTAAVEGGLVGQAEGTDGLLVLQSQGHDRGRGQPTGAQTLTM